MHDQLSEEWFAQRLGKVTASRVGDVMATTKSGPAASRKNYMMELLCQRLTGQREDCYTSTAMQRGTDLEPIARSAYEVEHGVMVDAAGLCIHPDIPAFAASPDGFVGSDGLLEIKCPNTAQHVAFIQSGIPDGRYQWQMLAQMVCTGRQWCDFASFDDRMPEPLQLSVVRFDRDAKRIAAMMEEIVNFLDQLDALEQEMRNKMRQIACVK